MPRKRATPAERLSRHSYYPNLRTPCLLVWSTSLAILLSTRLHASPWPGDSWLPLSPSVAPPRASCWVRAARESRLLHLPLFSWPRLPRLPHLLTPRGARTSVVHRPALLAWALTCYNSSCAGNCPGAHRADEEFLKKRVLTIGHILELANEHTRRKHGVSSAEAAAEALRSKNNTCEIETPRNSVRVFPLSPNRVAPKSLSSNSRPY